jgi:hypothetical protein
MIGSINVNDSLKLKIYFEFSYLVRSVFVIKIIIIGTDHWFCIYDG